MTFGERVANEALSWKGTPFVWGQSQKGVGCDCKGLIAGVARELGRPEADSFYANVADYRDDRAVPSGLILQGMAATFDRVTIDQIRLGDVLLGKHNGKPSHFAIYVGNNTAVHTQIASKAYVKATALEVLFHFYPLHSVWRWRRKGK
jgi:cell wall-associated NlpC family hydrolase